MFNATFYPVLTYDENLHKLGFVCCGGTPNKDQVGFHRYYPFTTGKKNIGVFD